jgi:hypothetical protein
MTTLYKTPQRDEEEKRECKALIYPFSENGRHQERSYYSIWLYIAYYLATTSDVYVLSCWIALCSSGAS